MAQHDYDLANQSGASFRSDLNNALAAIVSQNSGGSAPSTTYAFMPWLDTSVSPPRLKIRNSANSAWEEVGEYAQGADIPYDNSTSGLAATTVDTAIDEAVGLAVRKNLLINGDFSVWQRNSTFTLAVSTATYTADRWNVISYGAGVDVDQYQTAPIYGMDITGVASNTGVTVRQRIESKNCYQLSGAAATFSADIYSTGARTLTWAISTADSIDDFSASTQKHTDTVSLSAGWNYGVTFTVATMDSTVTRGMVLSLAFGAVTNGNSVYILDAQFEAGSVPTAFERLQFSEQLANCQRYYEKSYDTYTTPGTAIGTGNARVQATGLTTAAHQPAAGEKFRTTKRTTPTITAYSPNTGTSGYGYDTAGATDVAVTTTSAGHSGFTWGGTTASASYYELRIQWVADAEL